MGDGLGRGPAEHPKGGTAGGKSPAGPARDIINLLCLQNKTYFAIIASNRRLEADSILIFLS